MTIKTLIKMLQSFERVNGDIPLAMTSGILKMGEKTGFQFRGSVSYSYIDYIEFSSSCQQRIIEPGVYSFYTVGKKRDKK